MEASKHYNKGMKTFVLLSLALSLALILIEPASAIGNRRVGQIDDDDFDD